MKRTIKKFIVSIIVSVLAAKLTSFLLKEDEEENN